MQVGILTFKDGYHRNRTDFYPLIKWNKKLKNKGINIKFMRSHNDPRFLNYETVIIDHRYSVQLTKFGNKYSNKNFLIDFIGKLKLNGSKVILFDNNDGAGSTFFDIIEHVDLFVKKQLLKDRKLYALNRGYQIRTPLISGYNLSQEQIIENERKAQGLSPCPPDQLYKLALGWNIGMHDYREFPLQYFFPFGTNRVLNSMFPVPIFTEPSRTSPYDSSFRGAIRPGNENYSWQRNKVIEFLKKDVRHNYITGGTVSKKNYLSELRKSKTCVSPFGHGEICWRDFEAIISGCVLIKPNMSHLETFPNVFIENKTYVDIKWDISDIQEKIHEVLNNYNEYIECAHSAQELYRKHISDFDNFYHHFISILKS